jgi:hypothetical protein
MASTPHDDGPNRWRRQELIWALRWLAAEPEAAIAAYDRIVTADEIALDMNDWYEVARDWGLLDEVTGVALKVIDAEFEAMSDAGANLWTDEAIRLSPEWARQRERARDALAHMGVSRADADLGRPRAGGPTYVTGRRRLSSSGDIPEH